jgi:hypothetical protein
LAETPEQYRNRMLGHVKGQSPLAIQSATPQKIARLLKGVPKSKLRKRPQPAKWSAHEIMVHLADTEIVYGSRVRMILGQPGVTIIGFDQDIWVTNLNYGRRDTATALAQFTAMRKANIDLLKAVKPEQWKHFGMHSERGEESVEMMVSMMAGHDVNHLAQIERIVKPPKKR